MLTTLAALCLFAFLAGLVDAIAGGGGLIQLPALFILLPDVALPVLFGTNKLSSLCGTSIAAVRYVRQVAIPWRATLPAAGCALIASFVGARVVTLIKPDLLKPILLLLLVAVAVYTFAQKKFGGEQRDPATARQPLLVGALVGAGIGFYDGFFGPGTGSFLIFLFVALFGLDFLHASAAAKLVNVATNLAALTYFALAGDVLYQVALPMAACNILGALVGTRLAIARGNRLVRLVFMLMIGAVIARFGYDVVRGW